MEYKSISYVERQKNPELINKVNVEKTEHYILTPTTSYNEELQRNITSTEYQLRSHDKLKKYKISDFSLDNLISCGALANAKRVSLSNDKFTEVNNITSQVEKIINSK